MLLCRFCGRSSCSRPALIVLTFWTAFPYSEMVSSSNEGKGANAGATTSRNCSSQLFSWIDVFGEEWIPLHTWLTCTATCSQVARDPHRVRRALLTKLCMFPRKDSNARLLLHKEEPTALQIRSWCVERQSYLDWNRNSEATIASMVSYFWRHNGLLHQLFSGREACSRWPDERRWVCALLGSGTFQSLHAGVPWVEHSVQAWVAKLPSQQTRSLVYCLSGFSLPFLWKLIMLTLSVQNIRAALTVAPFRVCYITDADPDSTHCRRQPSPYMFMLQIEDFPIVLGDDDLHTDLMGSRLIAPMHWGKSSLGRRLAGLLAGGPSSVLMEEKLRRFACHVLVDVNCSFFPMDRGFEVEDDFTAMYKYLQDNRAAPVDLDAFMELWSECTANRVLPAFCVDCQAFVNNSDIALCSRLEEEQSRQEDATVELLGCLVVPVELYTSPVLDRKFKTQGEEHLRKRAGRLRSSSPVYPRSSDEAKNQSALDGFEWILMEDNVTWQLVEVCSSSSSCVVVLRRVRHRKTCSASVTTATAVQGHFPCKAKKWYE